MRKKIGYRVRQGFIPFTEGVVEYEGFNTAPTTNVIKKQGDFVIFNFAVLQNAMNGSASAKITIPKEYRPKDNIVIYAQAQTYGNSLYLTACWSLTVDAETGIIEMTAGTSNVISFNISNCGWSTSETHGTIEDDGVIEY